MQPSPGGIIPLSLCFLLYKVTLNLLCSEGGCQDHMRASICGKNFGKKETLGNQGIQKTPLNVALSCRIFFQQSFQPGVPSESKQAWVYREPFPGRNGCSFFLSRALPPQWMAVLGSRTCCRIAAPSYLSLTVWADALSLTLSSHPFP